MNQDLRPPLPLGDFKPADQWQTHINAIFYGMLGPGIHDHFQTYVSLDYRLAHTLAEDYFQQVKDQPSPSSTRFIQEWGVGNGNLAACFLTRLKELDTDNRIYPNTHYVLCDYSEEILKGVRANPRLGEHAGHFSTVQVDASQLDCFKPKSIDKIISNEIWDDLSTKVLLKHENTLYEEYLQPLLDPDLLNIEFESFIKMFTEKDLAGLAALPPFLAAIHWEKSYQRVDIADWPHAETIQAQMDLCAEEIPIPINTGAFITMEQARGLLRPESQGYTAFDYGMHSLDELNQVGRPYFNLYGGQYTFMVNFDLLARVGKDIGFSQTDKEYQHDFVGRFLNQKVASMVEIMQNHPQVGHMAPWDRDLLMVQTIHAINSAYRSPYKSKMKYPPSEGTPKKQRKMMAKLVDNLSSRGVPDTVAYVSETEVVASFKPLLKLGYREKDLLRAFQSPPPAIAFTALHFR
jgi:SAM-dependent MidA family methyltransferase